MTDPTYWQKWRCLCKQGHFVIRADRNLNKMEFHCITCKTTVRTEIVTIEYSA